MAIGNTAIPASSKEHTATRHKKIVFFVEDFYEPEALCTFGSVGAMPEHLCRIDLQHFCMQH